jgi:hypothetical protein
MSGYCKTKLIMTNPAPLAANCKYLRGTSGSVLLSTAPSIEFQQLVWLFPTTPAHIYIHNGLLGYVDGCSFLRLTVLRLHSTDRNEENYQQVYENDNFEQQKHESSFGHELVAGGAAFAGFKAFEDHQRKEGSHAHLHVNTTMSLTITTGKPVSHQFAKELLAGFAGAEVDKIVRVTHAMLHKRRWLTEIQAETKGEDWFDREKAQHEAKRQAEQMYDEHYVSNQGADQYDPNQYERPGHFDRRGWWTEMLVTHRW